MLNSSIALQILPLSESTSSDRIKIIDEVIALIKFRHDNVLVGPFETVIEGELSHLIKTLEDVIKLAGEKNDNIFANVKINYGSILSIDEKITKHSS